MKVIFIHDIGGAGRKNEIKNVDDKYALEFLIPNGHAVHATAERVKATQERVALEKRAKDDRVFHEIRGLERLKNAHVRILARANDAGGLFREVTPALIVAALQREFGLRIPPTAVHLEEALKKLGNFEVPFSYGTFSTSIRVTIAESS